MTVNYQELAPPSMERLLSKTAITLVGNLSKTASMMPAEDEGGRREIPLKAAMMGSTRPIKNRASRVVALTLSLRRTLSALSPSPASESALGGYHKISRPGQAEVVTHGLFLRQPTVDLSLGPSKFPRRRSKPNVSKTSSVSRLDFSRRSAGLAIARIQRSFCDWRIPHWVTLEIVAGTHNMATAGNLDIVAMPAYIYTVGALADEPEHAVLFVTSDVHQERCKLISGHELTRGEQRPGPNLIVTEKSAKLLQNDRIFCTSTCPTTWSALGRQRKPTEPSSDPKCSTAWVPKGSTASAEPCAESGGAGKFNWGLSLGLAERQAGEGRGFLFGDSGPSMKGS
ncbi:hypothetical protein B0H19DRAFT_1071387 [Mycena capillaripes]|nr:hypothetical protein B0H19DRAFT_1071387 [Mycena capillaripes]